MKIIHPAIVTFTLITIAISLLYWSLPGYNETETWSMRKARFLNAAERAEPLIEAIGQYTRSSGHPPNKLGALLPEFMDKIPATGLKEYKRFKYSPLEDRQAWIIWYDLGSRHGEPIAKQGAFSDGKPGHAILVFTLNQDNKVVNAQTGRMPKKDEAIDFDPEKWNAKTDRIEMVPTLADHYRIAGMPASVLELLFGTPDGSRSLRATPWELRINSPRGILNRDLFFYWPTGNYPPHIYGGDTELFGGWAYVHD